LGRKQTRNLMESLEFVIPETVLAWWEPLDHHNMVEGTRSCTELTYWTRRRQVDQFDKSSQQHMISSGYQQKWFNHDKSSPERKVYHCLSWFIMKTSTIINLSAFRNWDSVLTYAHMNLMFNVWCHIIGENSTGDLHELGVQGATIGGRMFSNKGCMNTYPIKTKNTILAVSSDSRERSLSKKQNNIKQPYTTTWWYWQNPRGVVM
jgi:hypothetical protein